MRRGGVTGGGGTTGVADATSAAGASGRADTPAAIGVGCGKPLPANQVSTIPGKPTGYTHYMVMGTGAIASSAPCRTKAGAHVLGACARRLRSGTTATRVVYHRTGLRRVRGSREHEHHRQLFLGAAGRLWREAIYVAL